MVMMDVLREDVRDGSLTVAASRRSCFVWGIIKCGYGQVWKMEKCSEKKGPEGECQ